MIFPFLTLLSGIALFPPTAAWPTPPIPVTHYVDVSNDIAGLVFDPPYIVSQPNSQCIDRFSDISLFQTAAPGDTVSFIFHPKNHTVTQSIFDAPCTPLFGGIDTGLCVLLCKYLSHRVFSDVFESHSVTVAPGTYYNNLPARKFLVEDVLIPFKYAT